MRIEEKKLDNPVWYSLTETHQGFSLEYEQTKFYQPDYCPFGGYHEGAETASAIDQYSKICENFFVVGERPVLSNGLSFKNELICLQMTIPGRIEMDIQEKIIELKSENADELFELVNLVQPGYFRRKTFLLGNYFGIFKDNQLVAVTGERMKMKEYTEVSAVVTHPGHAGRGYAKQLVALVVNKILSEKKMPYLHVAETNLPAIKLYENLGFRTRRRISFWNIIR